MPSASAQAHRQRRSARSGGSRRSRPSWRRASARSSSIVLPLVLVAVDVRLLEQDDLLEPLARPCPRRSSGGCCSGLSAACSSEMRSSACSTSSGTSVLGDAAIGAAAAMCSATSRANADEVVVAGDEVGLAVDLDQHADLAVGVDVGLRRCPRWPRARRAWRPPRCPSRAASRSAFSMSPSASASAFLQSIIPAPVRSRRALTSCGV